MVHTKGSLVGGPLPEVDAVLAQFIAEGWEFVEHGITNRGTAFFITLIVRRPV